VDATLSKGEIIDKTGEKLLEGTIKKTEVPLSK
jgi:hypothetical protein